MPMMIFKYPLDVVDKQSVLLPWGAKILCVQAQDNKPMMWAMVDKMELRQQTVHVQIVGTGNPVPVYTLPYLGTFQLVDPRFVGHVFAESL